MVFGEILFEVDVGSFDEWANTTKSRFVEMIRTMHNVAHRIELETISLIPLDTRALEQSFEYQIVDNIPSNFILLGMGYDVEDPDSGFHYAEYQHEEDLNHPRRGEMHYFENALKHHGTYWMEMIGSDYMSLFLGSHVMSGTSGSNTFGASWKYKPVYRSFEWK